VSTFASGEPYTLALLIRWTEPPAPRHLPFRIIEEITAAMAAAVERGGRYRLLKPQA
jgi:hypothetical protein